MSQSDFATAIFDPARPVPDGLTDAAGQPAGKRFSVYRNNVAVSLKEALETGFPATARLLGEDNFDAVAKGHLRSHPPASPLMALFGDGFADYIATIPALEKLAYLPDVARLEYAMRQSYHADDADPLDPARLAELSPEELEHTRLIFAPAVRLVRSGWPIHAIRQKALMPEAPNPPGQAQPVLITRPEYDPELDVLTPAAAAFIADLQSGATLGDASNRAPEADLGEVLTLLLTRSALTDIDVEDNK
ncbi:MAG: DNA-binding domain-containing protein [Thalassovita sp.]|nr:DNA-binding domain-containing protein [Thalassovita sp.]